MTGQSALAAWLLADVVALNAGLAVAVGAFASAAWLGRGCSPWAVRAAVPLRTALRAALALTSLASLGALWLQAAMMAETPLTEALPAVATVLSDTHFGRAWLAGGAGLALALAAAYRPARLQSWRCSVLVVLGLGVFAWSRSVVSHAGAHGDATWEVVVDVAHLLLVGLWAGEVFVGAFVLPASCGDADRVDRARWVAALSSSATLALAGIMATGVFNAWRGSGGSPGQLIGSAYGNALLVKLALVGVAAALGGVNRFFVMPELLEALRGTAVPAEAALRHFVRNLRVEAMVLFAVVIAAAVLGASAPPGSG